MVRSSCGFLQHRDFYHLRSSPSYREHTPYSLRPLGTNIYWTNNEFLVFWCVPFTMPFEAMQKPRVI